MNVDVRLYQMPILGRKRLENDWTKLVWSAAFRNQITKY